MRPESISCARHITLEIVKNDERVTEWGTLNVYTSDWISTSEHRMHSCRPVKKVISGTVGLSIGSPDGRWSTSCSSIDYALSWFCTTPIQLRITHRPGSVGFVVISVRRCTQTMLYCDWALRGVRIAFCIKNSFTILVRFLPRDAMLARYMLSSYVCLSVRLSVRSSVTSRSSTKTAKPRITQSTPSDSPGILILWVPKISANFRRVNHNAGA